MDIFGDFFPLTISEINPPTTHPRSIEELSLHDCRVLDGTGVPNPFLTYEMLHSLPFTGGKGPKMFTASFDTYSISGSAG